MQMHVDFLENIKVHHLKEEGDLGVLRQLDSLSGGPAPPLSSRYSNKLLPSIFSSLGGKQQWKCSSEEIDVIGVTG